MVLHPDLCGGGGQGGGHGGPHQHDHGDGGLQQGYGAEDLAAGPVPTAYGPPASTAYGPPASDAYGPPASGLAVSYGDGQATSPLLDQVAGHPLRQQGQSLASNFVGLQGKLQASVPDPDPHVCWPPGSGSTSQKYGFGSGSFSHQTKIVRKILIPTVL